MHPTVLDATGYTLLLSNFITFAILLWKGYKRKRKCPFYVLSLSDIFSATLMAVVLLVNHIEAGIRLNYNWQNNTGGDMPNHTWTIQDKRFPFLQMHLREVDDLDVTLTCGMKDIFMHYGMLLAALANAFTSLLTFAVQCNFNAAAVKRRCANVMKSSLKNAQLELPTDAEVKCLSELKSTSRERRIDAKVKSNVTQRIEKMSKFRSPKRVDEKPLPTTMTTTFLVTSHWLVPFLVAGILYFAEYNDMNNVRHTEDIECVFGSNFPMSDFHTFLDSIDNLMMIDSVAYVNTPPEENYFLGEKLSNWSQSSSVQVDEVVSKVQSIVRTALNSTKDMEMTNFINTSGARNLTEDIILTNDIVRYIKNITNINSAVQGLNGTPINVHNSSTSNIHLNWKESQVPLAYDVSEQSDSSSTTAAPGNLSGVSRPSTETEDVIELSDYQEDAQIHFARTEESTTREIADIPFVRNATFVSNDQIYDEIMKRIQSANVRVHSSAKSHRNRSASRAKNGNQPADISSLKNYIAKRKQKNSIENLFSNKNGSRYVDASETKQSHSPPITANECLVSTKFLKLQLFVLSLAIYFLPILLSSILQMRGKHMCKNTLAILGAKTNFTFTDGKKSQSRDSVEFTVPQGSRNDRSKTIIDVMKEGSCKENESIALEIDRMVRTLDTIKLSLILCVLLWSPVFLGTLLRVYSCTRAPQWLTDVTFLSAILFGIVRNVLNVNIVRIQEACTDANAKDNRIQPVTIE